MTRQHKKNFRSPAISALEREQCWHRITWKVIQAALIIVALFLETTTVLVARTKVVSWSTLLLRSSVQDAIFLAGAFICILLLVCIMLLERYWLQPLCEEWLERYRIECVRVCEAEIARDNQLRRQFDKAQFNAQVAEHRHASLWRVFNPRKPPGCGDAN